MEFFFLPAGLLSLGVSYFLIVYIGVVSAIFPFSRLDLILSPILDQFGHEIIKKKPISRMIQAIE